MIDFFGVSLEIDVVWFDCEGELGVGLCIFVFVIDGCVVG